MDDQPVSFKLSYLKREFWKSPKLQVEASDGQRYQIFHKQFGCFNEIIGLRQNGVSLLRLKPLNLGIHETIEVRTCATPWKTTATLDFKGPTLKLPTFQLEMRIQRKKGGGTMSVGRIKNEAYTALWNLNKCALTVYPGFLDITEELLLLSYWVWQRDIKRNDSMYPL